jgi:cytoskeletal protein RodZ
MPEIGPTLREARMRAKIDITEVEQATKIRAKYLRAIENEEWSLLPGPTFVRSFLREYADYLGLDARTLVEEYKLRHERPSEQDLPLAPKLGNRRGAGVGGFGPPRAAPRWLIVGAVLLLLVAVLYLVGSLGGEDGSSGSTRTSTRTATSQATTRPADAPTTDTPTRASVRLVPTGTVYVCLVDGGGRVLIPGTQFAAGQRVPTYRARKLRMTLGNNAVRLRVNDRPLTVPPSSTAIAYEITPAGAHALPADQAPTCT